MKTAQEPFSRILVATNGSEHSQAAVERGLELAASDGAEVIFVHVAPPVAWRYGRLAPASAIPRRLPAAAQDEALASAVARAEELGVPSRISLVAGNAAREIVSISDLVDADLIIVGKSGRNPFKERVAGRVLHKAKRTVMIAKRQQPAVAKPRVLAPAA